MSLDLPSTSAPQFGPISRVLLIDDEWEAHDIFYRMLNRDGMLLHFDAAFGGDEGIAYLERCRQGHRPWPAVVFIDIKMPGGDGFEVLRWANQHGVLGNAVFVMLSSSNEPKDVLRAFQLGVHHYVSKSSPPAVLRDLIQTASRFVRHDSADIDTIARRREPDIREGQ